MVHLWNREWAPPDQPTSSGRSRRDEPVRYFQGTRFDHLAVIGPPAPRCDDRSGRYGPTEPTCHQRSIDYPARPVNQSLIQEAPPEPAGLLDPLEGCAWLPDATSTILT